MLSRVEQAYADCGIVQIPTKYDLKPLAWGIQQDSPFIGLFNYYTNDMKEKGSFNQILKKYQVQPQVCPDSSGKPLSFGSCFTSFGFLVFGAILAIILFIIELIGGYIIGDNIAILNSYGIIDSAIQDPDLTKDAELNYLRHENKILREKLGEGKKISFKI